METGKLIVCAAKVNETIRANASEFLKASTMQELNDAYTEAGYWSRAAGDFIAGGRQRLWRGFSDELYRAQLAAWLPLRPEERILKTDLFDEAVSAGLVGGLLGAARQVHGIDLSPAVVRAARARYPDLDAQEADVRALPFPDGHFNTILSNSTLDHFRDRADIGVSLRELCRVLEPGGRLFITLDNLANPAIFIRQMLPFRLFNRLGILPYYTGATLGPRGMGLALGDAGFRVVRMAPAAHVPRLPAVWLCRLLERRLGDTGARRLVDAMKRWEVLGRWPTRNWTGYYVAALAEKHA